MYKQLIFITLIQLAISGVSAKEASNFEGMGEFKGFNKLSDWILSSKLMGKFTPGKNNSALSSCCFGCPEPLDVVLLPNYFYLPSDRETRLVTKTKKKL